jgi:hypothetical protein
MPLQNRVLPTGEIVALPLRGLFTGNRGIIHDPETQTLLVRRWSSKAWIICVCEFQGRRRDVMAMRSWTELFFLDEATAMAAGHRPCFYCRRPAATAFAEAWARAHHAPHDGQHGIRHPPPRASAKEIDAVLHQQRLQDGAPRRHPLPAALSALPDGAMVFAPTSGASFLIVQGLPLRWSADGYFPAAPIDPVELQLLTPPATLRALAAGYRPVLHPSAA